MAPRTDFLARQRKQIAARLQELEPLHEEYLTLLDAQKALDSLGGGTTTTRRTTGNGRRKRTANGRRRSANGRRRRAGRPRTAARGRGGTRAAATRAGRTRRRRTGGTRAEQALAVVESSPGATIPDIAGKLKIRQNYLYRVMAGLEKDKQGPQRGRRYPPAMG